MDQILNKVRNVDSNNSEEVKNVLSSFIQALPKYKELHSNILLRELLNVINRFPKYCMSHRNNIEIFLIAFLASNNYNNVVEAAKCAQVLQQVRPSQEKTATPKTAWRDQMILLCNAAHLLIEAVFSDAVDMYRTYNKPQVTSATSPMSQLLTEITKKHKDYKDKQPSLQTKLKNVLVFIQAMLIENYPVAKPIQPQTILDVIVRLLSVTSGKQNNVDNVSLKIYTLKTVDALIACLGSNLIPYSALVFRLVIQTLRWTSDNPCDENSKVRCAAYFSLSNWLTTLRVHKLSDNNTWEDDLTKNIVTDITPPKKVVELTMGPQPTKNLSKKAKRKLATTQLQESKLAAYGPGEKNKSTVSEEVNNEVALAALQFAETFLTVCGQFLKPTTHKLFQELLVHECFNYSSYSDEILLSLLRVLEATRKTTPNSVPPPTQYCLHLYSLLVNSQRVEISKFCSQSLLDIRLHLYCSPPSINFALEAPYQTEKTSNKRKKISEKNRAMLESLLGADKLPENEDGDVISLLDESPNKKPRFETEETDNISLSSNTISSVEISDDSGDNVQEVEVVVEINKSYEDNSEIESMEVFEEIKEIENELQTTSEQIQEVNNVIEIKVPQEIIPGENEIILEKEINKNSDIEPIYEAQTQIPLNACNDSIEDERPLSLEVGYDYPHTASEKIVVLEKVDDENFPSSNEIDDIQITCGQVAVNSQEVDLGKNSVETESNSKPVETPKVNGVEENVVENGIPEEETVEITKDETPKIPPKIDSASVEDMLADFVDEVNEEATVLLITT